jgi:hypothetical protein
LPVCCSTPGCRRPGLLRKGEGKRLPPPGADPAHGHQVDHGRTPGGEGARPRYDDLSDRGRPRGSGPERGRCGSQSHRDERQGAGLCHGPPGRHRASAGVEPQSRSGEAHPRSGHPDRSPRAHQPGAQGARTPRRRGVPGPAAFRRPDCRRPGVGDEPDHGRPGRPRRAPGECTDHSPARATSAANCVRPVGPPACTYQQGTRNPPTAAGPGRRCTGRASDPRQNGRWRRV